MSDKSSDFLIKSIIKSADREHRRKINFNISRYNAVVPAGKQQFTDLHLAREKAKNLKWKAIETLDRQLEMFESKISKKGGKVIWAETADEALQEILQICIERKCTTIVKSKSMVTEELHLNQFLERNNIESVE